MAEQSDFRNEKSYQPNPNTVSSPPGMYGDSTINTQPMSSNVAYYPSNNPPPYTEGYAQPQAGGRVVVQTMVPAMIVGPTVDSKPTRYTCKSCHAEIITRVEFKPSTRTHMMALLLCIFGCWPCVCLPYCMETCNNIDHYCPNCGSFVGTYYN